MDAVPQVSFYEDRRPALKRNKPLLELNDKTKTIAKRRKGKQSSEQRYLAKYLKASKVKSNEAPVEGLSSPWEKVGENSSNTKHPLKGKEDKVTKGIVFEKLVQEATCSSSPGNIGNPELESKSKERKNRRKRSKSKALIKELKTLVPPKLSQVSVRQGNGRFKLSKDKIKKERLRKLSILRKKYEIDIQKQISRDIEELDKEHLNRLVDSSSSFDGRKNGKQKLETLLKHKVSQFLENNNASVTCQTPNNDVENEKWIRAQYSRLLCKLLPKPILK